MRNARICLDFVFDVARFQVRASSIKDVLREELIFLCRLLKLAIPGLQ